ncbi:hypothetical protein Fmac_028425 [Flemingia macrophylla]|uniref:Uncharacterized protein n=1 Tax=Flemingia macrophylla TaxID=520843 RepID=A0ABD1L7I7_9FABA
MVSNWVSWQETGQETPIGDALRTNLTHANFPSSKPSGIKVETTHSRELITKVFFPFHLRAQVLKNSCELAISRTHPLFEQENENSSEKCNLNKEDLCRSSFPSDATEKGNEESTLTTAVKDGGGADFAESATELISSPLNWLDYVTGLVISAIVFQINFFVVLVKSPVWFILHALMFFVDPFGTILKGKAFLWGDFG